MNVCGRAWCTTDHDQAVACGPDAYDEAVLLRALDLLWEAPARGYPCGSCGARGDCDPGCWHVRVAALLTETTP